MRTERAASGSESYNGNLLIFMRSDDDDDVVALTRELCSGNSDGVIAVAECA